MRKYIPQPRWRRGATAIIAMLYLVLFSSLAVGFVAATQTAVQVAYNDDSSQRAQLAAESGMDFVRYHLHAMTIDRKTPKDQLLQTVYNELAAALNGSPNLGGGIISLVNGQIQIPADPTKHVFVNDAGDVAKFRAIVELAPGFRDPALEQADTDLLVSVAGYHKLSASSARGVQMDFKIKDKPSTLLKFGVAARGPIVMRSNANISGVSGEASFGSVLTTTTSNPAMSMAGSASVSGDVAITDPTNRLSYSSNASVGGYPAGSAEGQAHIHIGVEAPQFPYVDTSVFEPYATTVLAPAASYGGYYSNIRRSTAAPPSKA
jgi:hypothetical protein